LNEGSGVIVERFANGSEHRLLVVGQKLVAAAAGDAVSVIADGTHTIRELIELQVNSDPRRGDDETYPLDTVHVTPLVIVELEHQGYAPESVPAAGVKVIIRRVDNLSRDVTDDVHPSVAEHAVLAAQVVGLDVAGIDLVTQDISRPLEEQGGVIVEVNAGPGLLMHLKPEIGKPRPVGEAIINHLFPNPTDDGRIPIVSVTGTNGKTTVARLVTSILKASGRMVGLACTDGIIIDGRTIDHADCAGPRSAKNILLNPVLDAAVFEAARGGILREGLGFDKCNVAIVTNIAEADHLGLHYIDSPREMFKVKRTPVDVVMPTGTAILNATDPLVVEMKELSAGSVTFFAIDPNHSVIREHRANGKRTVVVIDGHVVLCDGDDEYPLVPLEDLPCTHGGRVDFQIENVLAAAAAGWALDLNLQDIRTGLQSFQGNLQDGPARFNVLESSEKTIVVMDGRNRSALSAVIKAIDHFPHTKRTAIYSAEEDRRDLDIIGQGQQLGDAFDRVILCEIDEGKQRPTGEVTRLLRQGVEGGSRTKAIQEIGDWNQAVDVAWKQIQTGELLLIQSSTVAKTVKKMQTLLGLEPAEAAA
jgi:cyanophycin synthetase